MPGDPVLYEVYTEIFRCNCLHAFGQLQVAHPVHVLLHMFASGAVGVILDCFVH